MHHNFHEYAAMRGEVPSRVNGQPIGNESVNLLHGDMIELAGTQMQFLQP